MLKKVEQAKIGEGTRVRHRVLGYEGLIEGTTGIKACFTAAGELLSRPDSKQAFQYRVLVKGESMRRIAPDNDLEILELSEVVTCPQCRFSFRTKPALPDKPSGRCTCGNWICPSCLHCHDGNGETLCPTQRKRITKKLALKKRGKRVN